MIPLSADKMERAWMLLMLCTVVSVEGMYTTRITTEPGQGPFRIGQQVQFSCMIEPMPPGPVTYQWRMVENPYGGSRTLQNFSRTFYEDDLHYCYYYCEVVLNGTLVGSASRIIEVQGYLYSVEPVVQSFNYGENLELNVNVSDSYQAQYISSIAWYHNGSEIVSGNKYSIQNNATRLWIRNMTESDAGTYEAKIRSLSFGSNDSPNCDLLVLPLLEAHAAYAPVTFIIQKQYIPVYEPAAIVSTYYLADSGDENRIELRSALLINSSLLDSEVYSYWFKNGTQIANGGQEGLSLTYNNTASVIGDYVKVVSFSLYRSFTLRDLCMDYYYNIDIFIFRYLEFPLQVSFWSIKFTRPPSSVNVNFEAPILSGMETTTVECTAVGGEGAEAFNLTLWWNGELLASTNGRHLSRVTTPYQYGAYRCNVDSVQNTFILKEKVYFQLLFGITRCEQNLVADLKTALADVLGNLCRSCDDLHSSDIIGAVLNCSVSGRLAYLTAGLVYSALDGRETASTLVTRLDTWLLSQDTPSLLIDGTPVALRRECPAQLNVITKNGCTELFTSDNTTLSDTSGTVAKQSTPFLVGIFAAGLVAGVLITASISALIICVPKLRRASLPSATAKPAVVPMGINQIPMSNNEAYKPVDARYQTCESMQEGDEVIYELPAV